MTDKMREEFEVAYQAACLNRAVARFHPSVFAKDHCEDYLSSLVQSAWWGWQASREALVIELPASPYMPDSEPESMTGYERGEAQGRCDMWASVREAIESAGLKVKP